MAKARKAQSRSPIKKPAKRSAAPKRKAKAPARGKKPVIQLYFWPTYNGLKITIMLEECRLPYELIGVNINKGDQFDPHFLSIAPNNRMPAIIDPDGPGGRPISIFESGAILQYLGRKTGKFYPKDERGRVEVDEWLFWQMAGLGPMAGQAHHFRLYAPEQLPYAVARYTDEMTRLYGVMDRRLATRDHLAGKYSIADIASWGVVKSAERHGQNLADFPNVKDWYERLGARPAVQRGATVGEYLRAPDHKEEPGHLARKILFGWGEKPWIPNSD